ncbi:MAG: type II toxin-antitoxin system YafQ family toxin [Bacteroidota bacterium]
MYNLNFTGQFKKDFKLCKKRGMDVALLEKLFNHLQTTGTLPAKNKPHLLRGNKYGIVDCHVLPDWILLYRVNTKEKEIELIRTGTHADLF